MPVSMEKIRQQAPDLVKQVQKAQISLSKRNLDGHEARVAAVFDVSSSMTGMFRSGLVQAAGEKCLALGTQFDDDGDIDIFYFHDSAERGGSLSIDDYKGGVDRLHKNGWGGTRYAPAINAVMEFYGYRQPAAGVSTAALASRGRGLLRRAKAAAGAAAPAAQTTSNPDSPLPVYVLFFTDGDCWDAAEAKQALIDAAPHPVFFQFVALGADKVEGSFPTLHKFNTMPGRVIDNANAFAIRDMSTVSDMALFDMMLAEYPTWLQGARAQGIL